MAGSRFRERKLMRKPVSQQRTIEMAKRMLGTQINGRVDISASLLAELIRYAENLPKPPAQGEARE